MAQTAVNLSELEQLLGHLPNPVVVQNDTTGIFRMTLPEFGCEDMQPSDFHVMDCNGDGHKDLIFNAPCMPYPQTVIFLDTDAGWNQVASNSGSLVAVETTADGFRFWVYFEAVGCIYTSSLYEFWMDRNGRYIRGLGIDWQPEEFFDPQDHYPRVMVEGMLRSSAEELDAERKDECTDIIFNGNQLLYFSSPVEALSLRKLGEWELVCVPTPDNICTIGWIKKSQHSMNANEKTIQAFYEGFQQKNHSQMAACYHDSASFKDQVFDLPTAKQARAMWHYLLTNGKDLQITFRDIKADEKTGTAHWEATYTFSLTGRKVHNVITANFTFQDGKIITHRDHFKFWKWTRMALGTSGVLLGWTPLVKNKVRQNAMKGLAKFISEHPEYQ